MRENYQDEADAPFLEEEQDARVCEWGPPKDFSLGPAGLCWHNAREVARSAPDEYLVAEGLAFNRGEWSGHGWAVRRSDGAVVECTTGYQTATRYRGVCFELTEVDAFLDRPSAAGGPTRREQWRKVDQDGAVYAEAPGVITVLAYEFVNQNVYWLDFWNERERWLNSTSCRP
jgi:hypothetical protein